MGMEPVSQKEFTSGLSLVPDWYMGTISVCCVVLLAHSMAETCLQSSAKVCIAIPDWYGLDPDGTSLIIQHQTCWVKF